MKCFYCVNPAKFLAGTDGVLYPVCAKHLSHHCQQGINFEESGDELSNYTTDVLPINAYQHLINIGVTIVGVIGEAGE